MYKYTCMYKYINIETDRNLTHVNLFPNRFQDIISISLYKCAID